MKFNDWKKPEIEEGKLTKWNWMVQGIEGLKLGNKTDIGAFTYINAKYGVEIGDNVKIGAHTSIYSESTIDNKRGKITIEKNAKIGTHSVIMPGITIGKNSIIGAFSFVNKDIPDNVIAYGVPVRIIKKENKISDNKIKRAVLNVNEGGIKIEDKRVIKEEYNKEWREVVEKGRKGDFKSPQQDVINAYLWLFDIKKNEKVLDVGCGYGREIPLMAKYDCKIYAIDILQSMIDEVKKQDNDFVKETKIENIEKTSYPNEMFDKIFCWATFDCLNQDKALCEMIRITKCGGKILITGRNSEYFDDDKVAHIAEQKAFENNFPINFTHINKLIKIFPLLGLKFLLGRGFKYRGDFGINKFEDLNIYKGNFYEYILIFEKIENKNFNNNLGIFNKHSKNYIKYNKILEPSRK